MVICLPNLQVYNAVEHRENEVVRIEILLKKIHTYHAQTISYMCKPIAGCENVAVIH